MTVPPQDGEVAARSADGGGSRPGAALAASPLHHPAGGPPPRAGEAQLFRNAILADLPAIVALLAEDTLGEKREDPSLPLDPGYIAAFETIAANPDQRQIVAELDGKVIGTMQLTFIPGIAFKGAWRGQIEAVRVASGLRGGGIGGAMIGHAVALCRARGCRMAQLTSDKSRTRAHAFYERLGWTRSHEGFKLKL